MMTRNRFGRLALGASIVVGFGLPAAQAGFPHIPFPPPPILGPPPVAPPPPIIAPPPPIHEPPPVHSTPEPATLAMGVIGAAIAGLAASRKRKKAIAG
jgi:PEP-CTERM motif